MKNELDIVEDISEKFERLGISYMLTGSMAMNYYAQPRMTRDIDVVIALRVEDATGLVELFEPEYYVPRQAVQAAVRTESMFNLIHQESVIKVDCIVRKSAMYRQIEFERRVKIRIRDFQTYIVTKEDLILSKLVWSKDSLSEIQLADIKNLLSTGYDHDYLELWARKLAVAELLEDSRGE